MIKILFFIESLSGGGAEKVLCNLVNNMNLTQFDITVQTVYPDAKAKCLRSGIHYKSMYKYDNKVSRIMYRLEVETGLAYCLHIKDDYDIEVAYLECGSTKVLAGSTNKKAKKIAWVHCDLVHALGENAIDFTRKTRKWYRKYDKVVCVSQQVKASFLELFGEIPESIVLYNTIDSIDIIRKGKEPLPKGIKKRKKTVLLVGRLSCPKNIIRLLKAHKQILENGIEHDVWILGEGEERKKIEKFITENQLHDSVTLFGFQDNPYCFMREADVLVCSSDYEGFSTYITEGLILGKPIVTTDVSGMRELLGDSVYGVLTGVNDKEFCEGLKSVLEGGEAELNRLALLAAIRGKDFIADQMVAQTESFFKML